MYKKATFVVFAILLVSISFSGCINTADTDSSKTVTITDMEGRKVAVPKDVDEVVGIEAGALRLLTYMNATDMVVGVENFEKRDDNRPYIMAHPELQNKPSIGPQHGGDPELITSQQPDVIFWTYSDKGKADELQEKTGIPVVCLRYGDLDDHRSTFYSALDLIGKILDKEKRADAIQRYIDKTISDLNNRTEDIPAKKKPSCYIGGIGFRGPHGISSTEPDYSPFKFVNADNVASGIEKEHASIDPEQIIEWGPDILFIDEGGYELVMQDLNNNSALGAIDAIKDDRVYGVMPYNYYTANYGTVLANSFYIGKILYPKRFEDVNPEKKADEIYKKLVGEGVYDEMEDTFGGFKQIDMNL